MSEQNKIISTASPVELPAKRKRGRPRKDGNVLKKPSPQTPIASAPESTKKVQNVEVNPKERIGGTMVGKIVTGVIDGIFDAGYFLTVRIGNSSSPLHGVVFQPGRYTPITVANDVAPQAKMYQRRELLVPGQIQTNGVGSQAGKIVNQPVQIGKQPPIALPQVLPSKPQSSAPFIENNQSAANIVPATILQRNSSSSSLGGNTSMQQNPEFKIKIQSQSAPPLQNLRMVEQDEVMQVFEVTTPSVGPIMDAKAAKDVVAESSFEPKAIFSTGNETTNQATDVQNPAEGSRIELDAFDNHELKQSYLELLQNSLGTNSQSVTQKIGAVESQPDKDQFACNKMKSQELQQPSGVSKCRPVPFETHFKETRHQPEMLGDIELNNPILELHEIPVIAQTQSVGEELQAAESKLQPSEIVHNDPKSSNIVLQHSSVAAQGPHVVDSNHQPCEFVRMGLNSSSLELHQTPIVAEDQSVSQEHQATKLEIQRRDLIQNPVKNSDLQLHPSPLVEKQQSIQAMEAELERNKLIHNALRNQNLELHPSLFGESHLLEFIHEPLDFMMERPNSPKNGTSQDVNKTRDVRHKETIHNKQRIDAADNTEGGSRSAPLTADETPYKLELAIKDSAPIRLETQILDSAGCTTNLGLPLGDDGQRKDSHSHSSKPSEGEHR